MPKTSMNFEKLHNKIPSKITLIAYSVNRISNCQFQNQNFVIFRWRSFLKMKTKTDVNLILSSLLKDFVPCYVLKCSRTDYRTEILLYSIDSLNSWCHFLKRDKKSYKNIDMCWNHLTVTDHMLRKPVHRS